MDRTRDLDPGPRAGGRSLSRTSTASSTTLKFATPASSGTSNTNLDTRAGGRSVSHTSTASSTLAFPTPGSSETSSTRPDPAPLPTSAAFPSGPLKVMSLSTTNWRPQYPRLGQFAMTPSEKVVAAGPDGLVSFMRVQDHPSKPWSELRSFPQTKASLNSSTVTGLALYQDKGTLHVYCVANGKMHAFSRSENPGSPFVVDPSPPFSGINVSGSPAAAAIEEHYSDDSWCIVAPCRFGGLLYTRTCPSQGSYYGPSRQVWEPANHVAMHLGIISASSVVATHTKKSSSYISEEDTDIVAVCIASGRLHSVEGPFKRQSFNKGNSWQGAKSIKIEHPGEATGNPVLLSNQTFGKSDRNLDLLVPSAEGGIFHFIRTPKSPEDWHMIGRFRFPSGIPIASCLACARLGDDTPVKSDFRAHIQSGGRLYLIKTTEGRCPWVGSQLYPIEGPGPFLH